MRQGAPSATWISATVVQIGALPGEVSTNVSGRRSRRMHGAGGSRRCHRSPALTSWSCRHPCPRDVQPAPSSASMVLSATIGSRSGRASVPNSRVHGETREVGDRQGRQSGTEGAIHEHETRRVERGSRASIVSAARGHGSGRGVGDRPQAGVFPRLLRRPAGQSRARGSVGGGSTEGRVAGQTAAQAS